VNGIGNDYRAARKQAPTKLYHCEESIQYGRGQHPAPFFTLICRQRLADMFLFSHSQSPKCFFRPVFKCRQNASD
jgi:hypothetical protein